MKKIVLIAEIISFIFLFSGCTKAVDVTQGQEDAATRMASSRLATLLGANASDEFPRVLAPRDFRFPEDHGPHPGYRNEWWYVTGNLEGATGERFGYELTLFRFALTPEPVSSSSAWRSHQVYVGHFALTEPASGRFRAAERYSRDGLGLAGARALPFRVWLDDWEIAAPAEAGGAGVIWRLRAADGDVDLDLDLRALKGPVLKRSRRPVAKVRRAGECILLLLDDAA